MMIGLFGLSCESNENTDNYKTYYSADSSFSVDIPPGYLKRYDDATTLISLIFHNEKEKGFITLSKKSKTTTMNDVSSKGNEFENNAASSLTVSLVGSNDTMFHYKVTAGFFRADKYFALKEGRNNNFILEIGAMDLSENKVRAVYNSIVEY